MTHILFATNRVPTPLVAGRLPDFTDTALPATPAGLLCGTADVAAIDIADPSSGTIVAISAPHQGQFNAADLAPLLASQNDILVFVHGAANAFTDAITRAAFNKTWLGMATQQGISTVCDMIAFSWPARSYVIADILGDFVDYRHDQAEAAASSYHFGLFLQQIAALRPHIGRRRINLLCHSMGNFMLGGAVQAWFANAAAPPAPIFDQIVLAAADEPATTFSTPGAGRLAKLWRLGREITVYFNCEDVAMGLSHVANQDFRLGYDGPPNAADTKFFSTDLYDFVDCTGVTDYISGALAAPDRSHQYYRQSPTVRADILCTLAGVTPQRLRFDAAANMYGLFPAPVVVATNGPGPGNTG